MRPASRSPGRPGPAGRGDRQVARVPHVSPRPERATCRSPLPLLLLLLSHAAVLAQPATPGQQLGPAAPGQRLGPAAPAPQLGPAEPGTPDGQSPAEPKPNDKQATVSAKYIRRDDRNDTLFARDVRLKYRDLDVVGSQLFADFRARLLHVDGPVHLNREDGSVFDTEWFDLDLDTKRYTTGRFRAQIAADTLGHGAVEPFNLYGSSSDSEKDSRFSARDVIFTSCPENDRKYYLKAKRVEVVRDRRITLEHAVTYLFGIPIFYLPKLVVPLKRHHRTDWLPEVGRNDIYGYFGRMHYYYDFAYSQYGNVNAMLTEKRGNFLGLQHDYGWGGGYWHGEGLVDLQYGTKFQEWTARGNLQQYLGDKSITLRVDGSLSSNSGFSSTSQQTNLTGQLARTYDFGSTTWGFSRSSTSSSASTSSFTRLNLQQRLNFGSLLNADANVDYSARAFSSQATDEELTTRFNFNGRWTLFDWELQDQRRFDIDGSRFKNDSNLSQTEIVPQVTLHTDSRRLSLGFIKPFDLRLDSSVGEFRELINLPGATKPTRSTVLRANWDLNGSTTPLAIGHDARLRTSWRYNQSIFDHPSPAAKYILAFSPTFEWRPVQGMKATFDYRWQDVHGFSPLQRFDFSQTLNDLTYTLDLFVPDRVRPNEGILAVNLQSGYDLLLGHYRDLRIGVQYQPFDELLITTNTSYGLDPKLFGGVGFRSVRTELIYDGGRRWQQDLGFTYAPLTGKFERLDSLLTLEPLHHFTIQNALSYDGFRKKITFNDILGTLDLGCVQLMGTWRQQVGEFRMDLSITAFPGLSSLFGTGRFGQQFSTSQGISF
ncbi:MAG: hypothetical protein HYU66_14135 [Armatimonadetes bacterium]|nr:hypothetical protein [Armatimonadota bacterium]